MRLGSSFCADIEKAVRPESSKNNLNNSIFIDKLRYVRYNKMKVKEYGLKLERRGEKE